MNSATRPVAVMIATCLALGLAACTPAVGEEPVGELIVTWSQEQADADWVTEIPEATLLTSPEDLDHWLQSVPEEAPGRDRLEAVDLHAAALVIGAYPRCSESSAVYADTSGADRTILRLAVEPQDETTMCVWAPVTVDAWVVPRDQTGDRRPISLSTGPAPTAQFPSVVALGQSRPFAAT